MEEDRPLESAPSLSFYTRRQIEDALHSGHLVISPLLDSSQIGPAAVDLRLGTQILVMKQTSRAMIVPRDLDIRETRHVQRLTSLSIGEAFTLHPGQFVLGTTLEYIRLAPDMCGMVLSRSRFGRAGLIVATASFVHPRWMGCLTLELFNAGVLPLLLDCGTAVAQLSIAAATPAIDKVPPAPIPTGPRFAVMDQMSDWTKLKSFRRFWEQQGTSEGAVDDTPAPA